MNGTRIAVLAAVTMVASGCATSGMETHTADEVKAYCAQRVADARIDPLRDKMLLPLNIGEPQPIEMLANRTFATSEAERQAILALAEAQVACDKFAAGKLGQPPTYRTDSQDRITTTLADLYAGDITYGDFAKSMLYIGARDQAAQEDIDQAIKARERWAEIDASN